MIVTSFVGEDRCEVEIRPNQSMSWRTQKLCFFGMVGIVLVIACGFVWLGFWPILPFAGAEVLALGIGLYLGARSAHSKQKVIIDTHQVAVSPPHHVAQLTPRSYVRAWTKVSLDPPVTGRCYPSRLVVGSHGQSTEVGSFLNEEERRLLAHELRRLIHRDDMHRPN